VLELEPEREFAWTSAAEKAGLSLQAWVVGTVDAAAAV
jgi:hypothetical protein